MQCCSLSGGNFNFFTYPETLLVTISGLGNDDCDGCTAFNDTFTIECPFGGLETGDIGLCFGDTATFPDNMCIWSFADSGAVGCGGPPLGIRFRFLYGKVDKDTFNYGFIINMANVILSFGKTESGHKELPYFFTASDGGFPASCSVFGINKCDFTNIALQISLP